MDGNKKDEKENTDKFLRLFNKGLYFLRKILKHNIKAFLNFLLPLGSRRRKISKKIYNIFKKKQDKTKDYKLWLLNNEPNNAELQKQKETKFNYNPKISIVVPMYNTPEKFFSELVDSILYQTYNNWELCLADGSDIQAEYLEKIVKKDSRIKYKFLNGNKGIAGNSNGALSIATGDFIALLDHDDLLPAYSLFEIVKKTNEEPEADFIYTDEDKIDADNKKRFDPYFKSDFSIDKLRCNNYICHMTIIKKTLMDELNGWNEGFDGSQDHDLILRACEKAKKIVHIPKILYHWRVHGGSVATGLDVKPYALEAGVNAIKSSLDRQNIHAKIEPYKNMCFFNVTYLYKGEPKISILIPNKDHVDDLKLCIKSISQTDYKNYEIIIIENNSSEIRTFEYYDEISMKDNIKIVHYKEKGFNFSKIINFGASQASGDYFVLLNNDVEIKTKNWLEILLGFSQREDVGAVGVKLLYPDYTVQHGGVIIGIGVASHLNIMRIADDYGYMGNMIINQNLSAVTGACMMVSRENFYSVNGFEEDLAVAYNDIDFCLKLREKNKLIVFTPLVEGVHYESKSRGNDSDPDKIDRFNAEQEYMYKKWAKYYEEGDPYFNPNFRLDDPRIGIQTEKINYK